MERSRSPIFLLRSGNSSSPRLSPYRDAHDVNITPTSPQSPLSFILQRQSPFGSTSSLSAAKTHAPNQIISLEDHTEGEFEGSSSLWAKSVTIDDYTVVGDSDVRGSYVVWNCTVETLEGGPMKIRKRYSEFDALRQGLVKTFPYSCDALPQLPRKSVVSRFRPRFLEKRRNGLTYFLSCVLLNPEFAGSPVLKDFLFS